MEAFFCAENLKGKNGKGCSIGRRPSNPFYLEEGKNGKGYSIGRIPSDPFYLKGFGILIFICTYKNF